VAVDSWWRSKSLSRYYHRIDAKSLPMGEREVRERSSRMEARAGVGDTPPWFTLLLVPLFGPLDIFNPAEFTVSASANVTSRTVPTSTTAALREPRQTSGVALLCGHALFA